MSYRFDYDPRSGLLQGSLEGRVTSEELLDYYRLAMKCARIKRPRSGTGPASATSGTAYPGGRWRSRPPRVRAPDTPGHRVTNGDTSGRSAVSLLSLCYPLRVFAEIRRALVGRRAGPRLAVVTLSTLGPRCNHDRTG